MSLIVLFPILVLVTIPVHLSLNYSTYIRFKIINVEYTERITVHLMFIEPISFQGTNINFNY